MTFASLASPSGRLAWYETMRAEGRAVSGGIAPEGAG